MGLSTGLYVAADAAAVGSERTTEMHRLQPTTNTPDGRGSRSVGGGRPRGRHRCQGLRGGAAGRAVGVTGGMVEMEFVVYI
jgi:hypothetical protein